MNKELTFNDLPMVVAQLRDEVVGMKQMITNLQSQNKPQKANTQTKGTVLLVCICQWHTKRTVPLVCGLWFA